MKPCIVLAVDTATQSGWCVVDRGKYHSSGTVVARSSANLRGIVKVAEGAAADAVTLADRSIVLVLEKSFGVARGKGARSTLLGLGAARALWLDAWCERMGTRTPRRVVSVYPQTWRATVLGVARGAHLELLEFKVAEHFAGRPMASRDEAAAVCIAYWASKSREVQAVLAPQKRKVRNA